MGYQEVAVSESIWFKDYTLAEVHALNVNMSKYLDIKFSELTPSTLAATMRVDHRTTQPMGLLHGGATCVLTETTGSIASNLVLDPAKEYAVGMNIYTQHLKSATDGEVTAIARAIHLGRSTHIWRIDVSHPTRGLVATSQLTTAVRSRSPQGP